MESILTMETRKTYSELLALEHLKKIAEKYSGLVNGNFSHVAHKYKIKVIRLRELYAQEEGKNEP